MSVDHPNYEMAISDNPNSIVLATQRSFVKMMKGIIADVKKDSKAPGMTWEQLEYFLDRVAEKTPTVVMQEHEL